MDYDDAEGETAESRNRGRYKQDVEREVDRIKVKVSFRAPYDRKEADG